VATARSHFHLKLQFYLLLFLCVGFFPDQNKTKGWLRGSSDRVSACLPTKHEPLSSNPNTKKKKKTKIKRKQNWTEWTEWICLHIRPKILFLMPFYLINLFYFLSFSYLLAELYSCMAEDSSVSVFPFGVSSEMNGYEGQMQNHRDNIHFVHWYINWAMDQCD
jgi:hypothetical protein